MLDFCSFPLFVPDLFFFLIMFPLAFDNDPFFGKFIFGIIPVLDIDSYKPPHPIISYTPFFQVVHSVG